MPELPEVEFGRRVAERAALGRRIEDVVCAPDRIVFDQSPPQAVSAALRGATVGAVSRRGKHLWFELDRRPWPIFHFGMTGAFRMRGVEPLHLASGITDDAWPPRFAKIHLHFDDGGELVMTNARRFGRIRLREDPVAEPPIGTLGFDPLLDLPDARAFGVLLESRPRITLKGLLLDQRFAAGVGNWIADEVLFQARLDPRRPVGSLGAGEVRRLRTQLGRVVRTAVAAGARSKRFPRNWLFHARWGRSKDAVLADGSPVRHLTVAGRTTAWVPSRQS